MARVSSETSLAHMSVDVTIAHGQQGVVDPTLIGVFDETLRMARRSEHDHQAEPSAPQEDASLPSDEPETDEVREREPQERDDVQNDPVDNSAVSQNETEPTDEVETETNEVESESNSEKTPERGATEEDAVASEEQPEETDVDAAAVVVPVPEEAAIQETGDSDAVGAEQADKIRPSKEVVEKADTQVSVLRAKEAVPGQSSADATPEETAVAMDEAVAAAGLIEEDSGEETDPEADQQMAKHDGAISESEEEANADSEKPSEDSNLASVPAGTPEDLPQDRESRRRKNPRTDAPRHERRDGVSPPVGEGRETLNDVPRPVSMESGPMTLQVQETPAAPDTAAMLPEPVAAEPVAPPSVPNANGVLEAVTGVESKSTGVPNRGNAAETIGKGASQGAVDSAKFVQRVANAFAALGQRNGPVRLKLYPPELGSLRMEISVKDGALSARVEAETSAARSLLVDNLPMLRDRLAEQGIKVDRFDVGVSDQSQGGPSEGPDDGGNSSRQTRRETNGQSGGREVDGESTERHDEYRPQTNGRLDVFI